MSLKTHEENIHFVFEISLLLKAFHASLEILGGFLIFFINKNYIIEKVLSYTQTELTEDPKDFIANYLLNMSNNFLVSSQHFIAFYLLSHGVIKLLLIIGLLQKKLWAYPASIVIFSLFILYQIYMYNYNHSIWIIFLTILDVIIIWLTVHEYNYMKKYHLFKR